MRSPHVHDVALPCLALVFILALNYETTAASAEDVIGATAPVRNQDADERSEIDNVISIFPNEVYYGDEFYVTRVYRNATGRPKSTDLPDYNYREEAIFNVVVILSYKQSSYLYAFEYPCGSSFGFHEAGANACRVGVWLESGRLEIRNAVVAETPPLDDWDAPFWRAVREDVEAQGSVDVKRYVRLPLYPRGRYKWLEDSIKIKRRPDSEMALLNKWRRDLDPATAPTIDTARHWTKSSVSFHEQDGNPTLKIGIGAFNCCKRANQTPEAIKDGVLVSVSDLRPIQKSFLGCRYSKKQTITEICAPLTDVLRPGNRKPSSPNAPRTLTEWQELERAFTDSALRDEIHFTTLALDYAAARLADSRQIGEKKKALIDWLKERPYAQKIAFINSLYDKAPELKDDLTALVQENVDGVAYQSEVERNDAEAILGLSITYDTILETTSILDPLVETGEANFKYDDELERYKQIDRDEFEKHIEKRIETKRKRMEAVKGRETSTRIIPKEGED